MLDVTGCTCPTGLLWRGVYDSTGVQYKVPEWVVVEPEGLMEDDDEDLLPATGSAIVDDSNKRQDDMDGQGEVVRVRARTSHNQRDVTISIREKENVASIVDKLKKQAQLSRSSRVRLAYGGRLYHDHETLESHPLWNYANEYILTALISTEL